MPDTGTNPAPGFAKKPEHRVHLTPAAKRVVVNLGGETVADSLAAILCEETGHDPVYYVPMVDTRADAFTPTARSSYCPYKGKASYWSIAAGGTKAENAAWSYDLPYDECAALAKHVAFYGDKVEVREV
ncbi:DUF427 domain-containing protein [Thalassobaculum sp. OXR-137]|uniref:DUF427 domain-containing protein n=1 Tax=Thalassobaculum sp. OXR-137 TaxID=3100173 RepID=UPI002AC8C12A|nr:DUF427 domain-containing protein [Thalassobaculum sp. OXR-137]WPZ36973.1 DUF427 domain-containing protein [Thalassobaculum sp. OXR-137]